MENNDFTQHKLKEFDDMFRVYFRINDTILEHYNNGAKGMMSDIMPAFKKFITETIKEAREDLKKQIRGDICEAVGSAAENKISIVQLGVNIIELPILQSLNK